MYARQRTSFHSRGIAAIEFALLLLLMMALVMGLFWSWHVLQTYQSLVRATGDGARFLQEVVFSEDAEMNYRQSGGRSLIEQRVAKIISRSLEEAGLDVTATKVQVTLHWTSQEAMLEVKYASALFSDVLGGISSPDGGAPFGNALRTASMVALP